MKINWYHGVIFKGNSAVLGPSEETLRLMIDNWPDDIPLDEDAILKAYVPKSYEAPW